MNAPPVSSYDIRPALYEYDRSSLVVNKKCRVVCQIIFITIINSSFVAASCWLRGYYDSYSQILDSLVVWRLISWWLSNY